MSYGDFSSEISNGFERKFGEISAEYNFDLGPEFEIAICRVLRVLLPEKYGICRGFIVEKNGNLAGDDIVIYDQNRFPALRLIESNNFSNKQKIPVESVYAYIEAKHTLYLEGDCGQSLSKAIKQIRKVKSLTRDDVTSLSIDPYTKIPGTVNNYDNRTPKIRNPMYAIILSRYVRLNAQKNNTDKENIFKAMSQKLKQMEVESAIQPDMIIAGKDHICLPRDKNGVIQSSFYLKNHTELDLYTCQGNAVGTGMASLFWAMDWMKLGIMHWQSIISSGLGIELS